MKNNQYLLGLIGEKLSHSFSEKYFQTKFKKQKISNFNYKLIELKSICEIQQLIDFNPNLIGLNITIPYKSKVLDYADIKSEITQQTNAANTLFINPITKEISAYNTDVIGFEKSLLGFIPHNNIQALILGSGAVSNSVKFVLNKLKIQYKTISRQKSSLKLSYQDISDVLLDKHQLIINCTPLGTYPNVNQMPDVNFDFINHNHFLFDLVYNPIETKFLKKGKEKGAKTKNGLEMLQIQAEESWEIWIKNLENF